MSKCVCRGAEPTRWHFSENMAMPGGLSKCWANAFRHVRLDLICRIDQGKQVVGVCYHHRCEGTVCSKFSVDGLLRVIWEDKGKGFCTLGT